MDNKSPERGRIKGEEKCWIECWRQGWVRWKMSWQMEMGNLYDEGNVCGWVHERRQNNNNRKGKSGSTSGCIMQKESKREEQHVLDWSEGRDSQPGELERTGVRELFPAASRSSSSPSHCFMTISWPLLLSTPSLPECRILYNQRACWETMQPGFHNYTQFWIWTLLHLRHMWQCCYCVRDLHHWISLSTQTCIGFISVRHTIRKINPCNIHHFLLLFMTWIFTYYIQSLWTLPLIKLSDKDISITKQAWLKLSLWLLTLLLCSVIKWMQPPCEGCDFSPDGLFPAALCSTCYDELHALPP